MAPAFPTRRPVPFANVAPSFRFAVPSGEDVHDAPPSVLRCVAPPCPATTNAVGLHASEAVHDGFATSATQLVPAFGEATRRPALPMMYSSSPFPAISRWCTTPPVFMGRTVQFAPASVLRMIESPPTGQKI